MRAYVELATARRLIRLLAAKKKLRNIRNLTYKVYTLCMGVRNDYFDAVCVKELGFKSKLYARRHVSKYREDGVLIHKRVKTVCDSVERIFTRPDVGTGNTQIQ